jgi:hypothetical protein
VSLDRGDGDEQGGCQYADDRSRSWPTPSRVLGPARRSFGVRGVESLGRYVDK